MWWPRRELNPRYKVESLMTSPLVYEVRKKLLAGQALTLARLLWQSSYYHEPYSEGLRALSSTRGAQDASNRSEEYRYLLFNHEAVIVIANWWMMEDSNLRRVINSLAVFKTAPLSRLGNHPNKWSRMQDLNLRLLAPKASVLPNCTNSRTRGNDEGDSNSNRTHPSLLF